MGGAEDNLETARRYIRAIEAGAIAEELERFLAREVVLETLPNRFLPRGRQDDLAGGPRNGQTRQEDHVPAAL